MKKLLLSLFLVTGSFLHAQDYPFTENCTSLTVGNLGTDPTGVTAGQNGWLSAGTSGSSPAATNSNFQVVNAGGTNGNVIQITGSSTASTSTQGQSRFIWHDLTNDWVNRSAGNDFAEVEFDLFSGAPTTSLSTFRNYIIDANGNAVAGFWFAPGPYTYTPTGGTATTVTKTLRGWAYYDATASGGSIGYYTFKLGGTSAAPTDLILADNTWYRLGVAYDYNTGAITWKDASGLFYTGISAGADPQSDITSAKFQVSSAVGNTLGENVKFDNVSIIFDSVENLLKTQNNVFLDTKISVFPNPATNSVTIYNKTDSTISLVEITDLNGRIIKTLNFKNAIDVQINIQDLSQGVYMMKISSEQGTVTKKIIKE